MSEMTAEAQRHIALMGMAKEFLNSELYEVICALAENELENAKNELVRANPDDPSAIRHLQNRVRRFEKFDEYIADLITVGEQAYVEYLESLEEN